MTNIIIITHNICQAINLSSFLFLHRYPLHTAYCLLPAKISHRSGFGQCIAEMYAAQLFNAQHHTEIDTVYGSVTTGSSWRFLRLDGNMVSIDPKEYFIDNLGKIMGILLQIVKS